jgi:hypothetical protein
MKILFLFLVGLLHFSEALSTTWTVDDDGTAQFTKIQDAVDVSSDGDTVFVFNGFYEECLAIPKNIFLIGENNQQTIVSSDQSKSWTIEMGNYSIIRNFQINDGRIGINVRYKGGKILDNIIVDNDRGIFFPFGENNGNNLFIYNNIIKNNSEGIFLDVNYPGTPDSVRIIGNTIHNNYYGIIYFPEQIISGPPFDTTWNVNADSNYWGYNDKDSISKYIWDKNDSEKAIAQLHYDYWYTDSLENQPVNISTGLHHNNIYNNSLYNVYAFDDQGTGINEFPTLQPNNFRLFQNYPNPFNNQTAIPFQIGKKGVWSLTVYNLAGQKVESLFYNKLYKPGQYNIKWRCNMPSGIYFIYLSNGKAKQIIKTILLK